MVVAVAALGIAAYMAAVLHKLSVRLRNLTFAFREFRDEVRIQLGDAEQLHNVDREIDQLMEFEQRMKDPTCRTA